MFTYLSNYDKALKILHHKLAHETIVLTLSLIGSINARMFLLTNQQVVLTRLNYVVDLNDVVSCSVFNTV